MMKKIIKLLISVAICLSAGFLGSIFTSSKIPSWYASLIKPSFNPPNWVFGPVWTTLFILMGVSLYLVWTSKTKSNEPYYLFSIQFLLNILWSAIFFGMQSPFYALIEIVLLWILILLTMISFWKISKTAGMLLIPYILWVSFAAFLNLNIWLLNP